MVRTEEGDMEGLAQGWRGIRILPDEMEVEMVSFLEEQFMVCMDFFIGLELSLGQGTKLEKGQSRFFMIHTAEHT